MPTVGRNHDRNRPTHENNLAKRIKFLVFAFQRFEHFRVGAMLEPTIRTATALHDT